MPIRPKEQHRHEPFCPIHWTRFIAFHFRTSRLSENAIEPCVVFVYHEKVDGLQIEDLRWWISNWDFQLNLNEVANQICNRAIHCVYEIEFSVKTSRREVLLVQKGQDSWPGPAFIKGFIFEKKRIWNQRNFSSSYRFSCTWTDRPLNILRPLSENHSESLSESLSESFPAPRDSKSLCHKPYDPTRSWLKAILSLTQVIRKTKYTKRFLIWISLLRPGFRS